jgi:methylmalonyl-CoA mutase
MGGDAEVAAVAPTPTEDIPAGERRPLARTSTAVEGGTPRTDLLDELRVAARQRRVPVPGVTGRGGSGKSSLADEPVRRFRLDFEDGLRIAAVAVDPTRRRAGGALLGDRRGAEDGQAGALTPVDTYVPTGVTTVVPAARARQARRQARDLVADESAGATPSPGAQEAEASLQHVARLHI